MEAIISAIVEKILKYSVAPVVRQFGYLIRYKSNVAHLTNQTQQLCKKRDGVNMEVEPARDALMRIDPGVESWLEEVRKIMEEKETRFKEETVATKATCCNGWFPNLKFRHSVGRKAKKMTSKVDELITEGNFTTVAHPGPPPQLGGPRTQYSTDRLETKFHQGASSSGTSNPARPPAPVEISECFDCDRLPYTKEVLGALQDDNITMIGICGVITGGETVTAKEFMHRVKTQDLFEEVVIAVVSQIADLRHIQSEIAHVLELNLENKSLPEGAKILHAKMSQGSTRLLVILVDVWKMLDLDAIGIPLVGSHKIVLTSPDANVFSGMTTQSNFKTLLVPRFEGEILAFESRSSIIRDVIDALKDDQVNPIIICGMSGIGKTTLADQVRTKAKAEGLFDVVAMARVSREPDLIRIQNEIADFLGLKLEQKEVPGRACKLRDRLSSERLSSPQRILIILEDVWTKVELRDIGIPISGDPNCKILVTSCNKDVSIDKMKSRKTFPVGVLAESEAWTLLKVITENSEIESPELLPIAKDILRECAGLPLAIVTVGSALKNKNNVIWEDAAIQLTKSNIPEIAQNVYHQIEVSFKYLESKEAKSCIWLCCLFSDKGNILVEDLVRYAFGLGLFEGIASMKEERGRVEALLEILKSRFFLLDSNKEGCVKMHDVVHQVVLSIASKREDWFVERRREDPEGGPNLSSQSYTSSTLKISKKTELVLLSCTEESSMEPPDRILNGMPDLKVLDIRWAYMSSILPSILLLKGLQTLRLEHCNLESVFVDIGELQTLLVLSFCGSSIKQLPGGIEKLSNLRLLDLTECRSQRTNSMDVAFISSLAKLEELYMRNSFVQLGFPDCSTRHETNFMGSEIVETNAELSKLLSLKCLTSLETVLPIIDDLENSLLFRNLQRFKISIPAEMNQLLNLNPYENYLRIGLLANSLVDSEITRLLKRTTTLELNMRNLRDALNVLDKQFCKNLKSLTLNYCNALQYVIDKTGMDPCIVFPVLESLKIHHAIMLKEICHGDNLLPMGSLKQVSKLYLYHLPALTNLWKIESQPEYLGNLRSVEVQFCERLKSVFQLSAASNLKELEKIDIKDCRDLEEIFVAPEGWGNGEEANDRINFPNLIVLNLEGLSSLVAISKNIYSLNFPQLITLKLQKLPQLISLIDPNSSARESGSNIQHLIGPKAKFGELQYMEVDGCAKLSGIFSSSSVQNLQNLVQLVVRNCGALETLFDLEGLQFKKRNAAATLLSCLEKMKLSNLPALKYVWNDQQNFLAFQNLRKLKIVKCSNLKFVFPLFVVGGLMKLESMSVSTCTRIEAIIDGGGDGEATNKVVFQVKVLRLQNLNYLRTLCPAPCRVDCPSLKTLELTSCRYTTFGTKRSDQTHFFTEKV